MAYPADAFDSRLRGDKVPLGGPPTKSQRQVVCNSKIPVFGRSSDERKQVLTRQDHTAQEVFEKVRLFIVEIP